MSQLNLAQCIQEAPKPTKQIPIADYDFVELNQTKALDMPQHRSGRMATKTKSKTQTTTVQVAEESDYDFAFEFQVILHLSSPFPAALFFSPRKDFNEPSLICLLTFVVNFY